MKKKRISALLSWPHFSEALLGARECNHLFHFRADMSAGFASCQDPACARHANPGAAAS